MNTHLVVKANNKDCVLNKDASISLEFQNPLWNENVEMFSYPVELPIDGNRDLLKNLDHPDSDLRPISLEYTPMQIIADGIPLASGPMVVSDDVEIENYMGINIDASIEDFNSMIGDLTCRDIPIPESDKPSLIIGEKISNVNVVMAYTYEVDIEIAVDVVNPETGEIVPAYGWIRKHFPITDVSKVFEPQALGFSFPGKCVMQPDSLNAVKDHEINYPDKKKVIKPVVQESYINVTDEYLGNKRGSSLGGAKFCNARISYKHYDIENGNKTSGNLVTSEKEGGGPEDYGPYWVLDANRPQSGICFYVLYFLECLFKHLGVRYDISALLDIEDMKHLCFFTTRCSYELIPIDSRQTEPTFKRKYGRPSSESKVSEKEQKSLFDDVNAWLDSRGCGGNLELEPIEVAKLDEFVISDNGENDGKYKKGERVERPDGSKGPYVVKIKPSVDVNMLAMTADVYNMVADSGNFPDMSVSSLLSSLENMFGIKFSYNYEERKVTAYLLRDVLCTNQQARPFNASVLSVHKVTEKITGVSVGYSEEQDAKEQKDNIKNGIRDYDTAFNYIDFPDPSSNLKNKTTIINKTWQDIFRNPGHGDENSYIDIDTGNVYRVKIDSEASTAEEMHPAWFRVALFKGVEEGDCSKKNEDFVIKLHTDFIPVSFNDVNYQRQKNIAITPITADDGSTLGGSVSDFTSVLSAFMPDDMEHEFIEQRIRQNLAGEYVDIYFTEILKLVESYDPSKTKDGNSPLQEYDWGNSIAMMRGSGADATIERYDSNYDGFNNDKWRMNQGAYALETDSIDQWGNVYDYNGTEPGGYGEHFSLMPRAYRQPSWAPDGIYTDAQGNRIPLCRPDQINPWTDNKRIRIWSRGYVDTFLRELIYFLLNRKKYRIRCLCSVAQVADIPNHWNEWWLIDDKKCLINRVSTDISADNGLGEVELEVYAI